METDKDIWKLAVSAIDIPLFVVDARRTIVFANQAVRSLVKTLGFVEDVTGAEGKSLFELEPMLAESAGGAYETLFATGSPQQDEHTYHVGNALICIQSQRYPIFAGQEVSHVVTIIRDVTDLRATQAALKHSEETALAIINASSESILLADENGTIMAVNDVAAERLGRSKSDIIGRTGKEILPPVVWRRRQRYNRELLKTKKKVSYRDVRGNIVFDTTMYPVLDNAGNVIQIACFASDVTQRVAAQEELIRIRQAVESSSDAIGITDMTGKHVFSNKAFDKMFGYTVQQLDDAGGPVAAYRDAAVATEILDTIKSGRSWSGVTEMVARGGREMVVEIRADAIRDQNGRLIGLIGIHTDVTEQRHASTQLKRSEERFRLQFRSVPIPTFIWEHIEGDFFLRDYNTAAEAMTKGGIVDFLGRHASDLHWDQPDILADLAECVRAQETLVREMLYRYHLIQEERFLQVYYVPIPPNLVLVHTVDLTERNRIEAELQSARTDLELKVSSRTEALRKQIEFDSLVRHLLTSFASCRVSEIDDQIRRGLRELAEFTGTESAHTVLVSGDRTSYRVTHSWVNDEWPDYSSLYQNAPFGSFVWLEKKILGAEEVHIRTLDDFPSEAVKERYAYEREGVKSALLVPLRGRGGSIKGAIGLRSYSCTVAWEEEHIRWLRTVGDAVANVLERKQAEEDLEKSEQRLSLHVQQTPLAVIEWDTDFRVIRWNPGAQDIFGYSEAEATGRHSEFIVPAEARKNVDQVWNELLKRRGGSRSTNANLTKDGMTIICEWYNTPLTDAEGKVIGVASLAQNVTDRVRAETELARAYEQLQVEREALKQKNIALQEMVEQIQESKRITAAQIQTNLERIVLPVIERIGPRLDPQGQQYLTLVRTSLSDILSPFVSNLESQFKRLSPREIEICELIRRGYDSKQIADLRNSSPQTVLKQRKAIRKKLGLDRKKINLSTYLTSTFPAQRKREKKKIII